MFHQEYCGQIRAANYPCNTHHLYWIVKSNKSVLLMRLHQTDRCQWEWTKEPVCVSFSLATLLLTLQAHIWLVSIKHQRGEEEVPLLIQVLSAVLSLDEVGLPAGSPRRLITDLLSTLEHPWNRLVWFINSRDLNVFVHVFILNTGH